MEDVFKTLNLFDDNENFRGYTKMIELYNALKCITMLILAHLSRRLIGELIGYSWPGVRPSSYSVRRKQFQTPSSPKPLARSKPNFM